MRLLDEISVILFLCCILVMIAGCSYSSFIDQGTLPIDKSKAKEIPKENGTVKAIFCPRDDCSTELIAFINDTEHSIYCAFFDLDLEPVIDALETKSETDDIKVKVVVDNNNMECLEIFEEQGMVRFDTSSQYSHNKFCVRDNKTIWTGSMNPTENGAFFNNNNVIIIDSTALAQNYLREFQEIWQGQFGTGEPVEYPVIEYNGYQLENYFCPEDDCQGQVLEELDKAQHSVYFMTFSFTDDRIGTRLVYMSKQNITVRGIFEARQNPKYSEYDLLKYQGLDVIKDSNPKTMHHKIFIIDNKTVITGSYNPTKSANEKNDENILIIRQPEIIQKYLKEFEYVYDYR